ncbi:1410_t:CDS:2 [Cetraspora pellucida]|uniref:1410_t:CDS:1 n=1 Tax=Cetraspora pellucida TaxID=1433469 RepID=A0A9N9N766_9GLOM|nr:1410_t:CDS:2 [Cetraspora pellucida]
MERLIVREWVEIISNPIAFGIQEQQIISHTDLPVVKDELSLTLRLKLQSHSSSWATIFHKGNWDSNAGIMELGDGLSLQRWYHIAYTLSDSEKRLDVYLDGEWLGFYSIQEVKKQRVIFNDGPLHIGKAFSWNGFNGEIRNVRYFNWRLSVGEVKEDFFKKSITYGSKVALVHVTTGKYLSTKEIKYDSGPDNKQYMVICSNQYIDLINDVWTIIGAHDENVNTEHSVSFNTVIGFKHQATKLYLHSHSTSVEVIPKSNYQQVTLDDGRNFDDDWEIKSFGPGIFYSYLRNEDTISLFHTATGKPALYSQPALLLDDGSQEVCCYGNENDENNKWFIKLIE